jgi:hypothetical protein
MRGPGAAARATLARMKRAPPFALLALLTACRFDVSIPDRFSPDSRRADVAPRGDAARLDRHPDRTCHTPAILRVANLLPDVYVSQLYGDDDLGDGQCIPFRTITKALARAVRLLGVGAGTYKDGEDFPLQPPPGVFLVGEVGAEGLLATIDGTASATDLIAPTGAGGLGVAALVLKPAAGHYAIESRGWPLDLELNVFEGPGRGVAVSTRYAVLLANRFKAGPAVVTSGDGAPRLDGQDDLGNIYPGANSFDSITTKPIIDHQAATDMTARGNTWPKPPPICGYIQVGKGGSVVVDDGETCVAP